MMREPSKQELEGRERMQAQEKKFVAVLERSTKDQVYRQRLRSRPVSVLREAGIDVPDGVEVRIRDFDQNCRYVFLPPLAEKGA